MWPDWAIYLTLSKFLKSLATINLPKSPTFLGIFVKVSKSIIFLVKSFLGNFYRHLAIFFWSHAHNLLCYRFTSCNATATSEFSFFQKILVFAFKRSCINFEASGFFNCEKKCQWLQNWLRCLFEISKLAPKKFRNFWFLIFERLRKLLNVRLKQN